MLGGGVGVFDGASEIVGLALGDDEGDLLGAFVVGDIDGDDEGDLLGASVPVLILISAYPTLALVSIELTVTSTSPSVKERVYVPPAESLTSSVDLA